MPISRICTRSGTPFTISDREQEYCESRGIPLPDISYQERFREMCAFRNESTLFIRKSSQTGQEIVSCYRPDSVFPVIEREIWFSEQYDPLAYGQAYDFNRPFFEQYRELLQRIPHPGTIVRNIEASPYVNLSLDLFNCYYCFACVHCQDSYYNWRAINSRDCVDNSFIFDCELCYECIDVRSCYNVKWASHAFNCRDSAFLYDCVGCNDCFGCVGLEHKQYHIFNVPYSKEEYFKTLRTFDLSKNSSVQQIQEKFQALLKTKTSKYNPNRSIEHSTGLYLENCNDCTNSYFLKECEGIENSYGLQACRDCFSCYMVASGSQLLYRTTAGGRNSYNCQFCCQCDNIVDCQYSGILYSCEKMFGCFGFPRRASYCILNRQYSKEAYEEMLPRIIAHMKSTGEYGKFFPMAISDFPYVDTVAQEYFSLTQQQIQDRCIVAGRPETAFHFSDTKVFTAIDNGSIVADNINDVSDSILGELLRDELTGRAYKLQKKELAFYRKMGVPVPRFSFETRHLKRSRALFQF